MAVEVAGIGFLLDNFEGIVKNFLLFTKRRIWNVDADQRVMGKRAKACTDVREFRELINDDYVIENLRRCRKTGVDIRRPDSVGCEDDHGNLWFCFSCTSRTGKDHKSFQSSQSFMDHLRDVHSVDARDMSTHGIEEDSD